MSSGPFLLSLLRHPSPSPDGVLSWWEKRSNQRHPAADDGSRYILAPRPGLSPCVRLRVKFTLPVVSSAHYSLSCVAVIVRVMAAMQLQRIPEQWVSFWKFSSIVWHLCSICLIQEIFFSFDPILIPPDITQIKALRVAGCCRKAVFLTDYYLDSRCWNGFVPTCSSSRCWSSAFHWICGIPGCIFIAGDFCCVYVSTWLLIFVLWCWFLKLLNKMGSWFLC